MNLINWIDSVLGVIDFVEREDVRRYIKYSIAIGQSILLSLGLLAIVVLCLVIGAIQAIYRQWHETMPVAIAAFKEGYAGGAIAPPTPIAQPTTTKAKTETQRLRAACSAAGIPWRNVRGRHKHATVVQMRQMLHQRQIA